MLTPTQLPFFAFIAGLGLAAALGALTGDWPLALCFALAGLGIALALRAIALNETPRTEPGTSAETAANLAALRDMQDAQDERLDALNHAISELAELVEAVAVERGQSSAQGPNAHDAALLSISNLEGSVGEMRQQIASIAGIEQDFDAKLSALSTQIEAQGRANDQAITEARTLADSARAEAAEARSALAESTARSIVAEAAPQLVAEAMPGVLSGSMRSAFAEQAFEPVELPRAMAVDAPDIVAPEPDNLPTGSVIPQTASEFTLPSSVPEPQRFDTPPKAESNSTSQRLGRLRQAFASRRETAAPLPDTAPDDEKPYDLVSVDKTQRPAFRFELQPLSRQGADGDGSFVITPEAKDTEAALATLRLAIKYSQDSNANPNRRYFLRCDQSLAGSSEFLETAKLLIQQAGEAGAHLSLLWSQSSLPELEDNAIQDFVHLGGFALEEIYDWSLDFGALAGMGLRHLFIDGPRLARAAQDQNGDPLRLRELLHASGVELVGGAITNADDMTATQTLGPDLIFGPHVSPSRQFDLPEEPLHD